MRFWRFILSFISAAGYAIFSGKIGRAVFLFMVLLVLLHGIRMAMEQLACRNNFKAHRDSFKKMFGPYGQKVLTAAITDPSVKRTLNDVFTPDRTLLEERVKQLEIFQELARFGIKGQGVHDSAGELALAYGKQRLKEIQS